MPEDKLPQPRNMIEAMYQNIYALGQNQKIAMDMIAKISEENTAMRNEIAELRAMFNAPAPELPNAVPGSESAVTQQ